MKRKRGNNQFTLTTCGVRKPQLELPYAVLAVISDMQYSQFSLLFSPLLSEALRKLEAKRQTAKEKILKLEIKHSVADETWLHTDFSTNESAYNDYIKSHYLQEYSGMTLRFDSFVVYTITSKTTFSFYSWNYF